MKRRKARNTKPQIRLVGWEVLVRAAVAVAGLASGVALAAPGDLDPSFGQVGRRSDIDSVGVSNLWSVDVRPDDSVLFGGGGEYDGYYSSYVDDFIGSLLPDGTADAGFAAAAFTNAAVYDTAMQPDGMVLAVGTVRQPDGNKKLLLYRLLPSGALDTSFGLNGAFVLSDGTTRREAGYSVSVDPAGNIVVAGGRGGNLLVVRITPSGLLDSSFGTGGTFTGPEVIANNVRIESAPAGGYRLIAPIATGTGWDCTVVGLTAAGALDTAFGTNGLAVPPSASVGENHCSSLAVLNDGRIVVGGYDGSRAFVGPPAGKRHARHHVRSSVSAGAAAGCVGPRRGGHGQGLRGGGQQRTGPRSAGHPPAGQWRAGPAVRQRGSGDGGT
jgi:uncharacterized delta-60 repeat protein